jgi:hypothetical protein
MSVLFLPQLSYNMKVLCDGELYGSGTVQYMKQSVSPSRSFTETS